jgi:hypothetical protein
MSFTVGEIDARIGLDTSAFERRIEGAGQKWSAFASALDIDDHIQRQTSALERLADSVANTGEVADRTSGKADTLWAGLAGGIGGALATRALSLFDTIIGKIQQLGDAVQAAARQSFASNAQFEAFAGSFEILLGSVEAAQQRIAELARFGVETPFEFPDVVEASRQLEVLTAGALSTGDGLRMIGDLAAGTRRPFQELAEWVGRAYDAISSGRPTGMALRRLQEMGILSGEARNRIEEMLAAGERGEVVWATLTAEFERFDGMMANMANSFEGVRSNLVDLYNMLLRELGEEAFVVLRDALRELYAALDANEEEIRAWGKAVGEDIGRSVKALLDILRELVDAGYLRRFADGLALLADVLADTLEWIERNKEALELLGRLITLGDDSLAQLAMTGRTDGQQFFDLMVSGADRVKASFNDALDSIRNVKREMSLDEGHPASGGGRGGFGGDDPTAPVKDSFAAEMKRRAQRFEEGLTSSDMAMRTSLGLQGPVWSPAQEQYWQDKNARVQQELAETERYNTRMEALNLRLEANEEAHGKRMGTIHAQIAKANADHARQLEELRTRAYERLAALAERHAETMSDMRARLREMEVDYQSSSADRYASYQQRIADIHERAAERRLAIEQQIAQLTEDYARAAQDRAERAAARIQSLTQSYQDRMGSIREQIQDILGDIPAAHRARLKPGEEPERLLSQSARKQLDRLRRQAEKEQENYNRRKAELEAEAAREVSLAHEKHNQQLAALQERLRKEEQERQANLARVTRDYEQQEARARASYEKQVQALRERMAKEQAEYAKQDQQIRAQLAVQVAEAERRHQEQLVALYTRLRDEQESHRKTQQALRDEMGRTTTNYIANMERIRWEAEYTWTYFDRWKQSVEQLNAELAKLKQPVTLRVNEQIDPYLRGRSPSPFEESLNRTSALIDEISHKAVAPDWRGLTHMPLPALATTGGAGASAMIAGRSGVTLHLNTPLFGTVVVKDAADEERLARTVLSTLERGLDTALRQATRFPHGTLGRL